MEMVPRRYVTPGSKLYLNPITRSISSKKISPEYSETLILINPLSKVVTYMEDDTTLLGRQKWEVVENGIEIKDMDIHFKIGAHSHFYRRYEIDTKKINDVSIMNEDYQLDKFVEVTINGKTIEVY
jgi:hypothetical protein